MRIPVAAEGWPFIFPPAVAVCILGWMGWWPVAAALGALALCFLAFFRDPDRLAPVVPGAVLAPADGRVMQVVEIDDPWVDGGAGIDFLSPLTCSQRSPVAALVEGVHTSRALPAAYRDEPSDLNERCTSPPASREHRLGRSRGCSRGASCAGRGRETSSRQASAMG